MTREEARQIIEAHYKALAQSGNEVEVRHAVHYLGVLLAEHMAWDSAIVMAEWLKSKDAKR